MESITGGNTPKYQELMEQLRLQIVSGEIAPGQKLPSENTLSAQYQVSRQTVRKALAILQNEGYIYAEHGRGTFCSEMMRHAHPSKNIAVVTTYLSDYIFPRVIQGIDDVLTGAGYSIVLKNTKNSRTREAECLQEILSKDIDGVIIEPSKSQIFCRHMNLYEQLEKSHIPYVFIQGCFPQMKDKPHVLLDDFQGGYMITKYLTDHGHKNIVGVFKADDMQGQNRHKGYVLALQEAEILYDPDKVVWFHTEDRKIHPYEAIREMAGKTLRGQMDAVVCYNDQTAQLVMRESSGVDSFYRLTQEVMRLPQPPDAIFTTSDPKAFVVMHALHDMGVRIPEDVSVTGYDNSSLANQQGLRLTTIDHPQEKLGAMAAELLLSMIQNGEKEEGESVLIQPMLIEGNSCMEYR